MADDAPTRSLTKEAAVALLVAWARKSLSHRLPGEGELEVTNIESVGAYEIVLETFVEQRTVTTRRYPFHDRTIDSPDTGAPVALWDVPTNPPTFFAKGEQTLVLPQTGQVEECTHCDAEGRRSCSVCKGTKKTRCLSCGGSGRKQKRNGSGYLYHSDCNGCKGRGKFPCTRCTGGKVRCPLCNATKRLECREEISVSWRVHTERNSIESTDVPDELMRHVTGAVVLVEEAEQLHPTADLASGYRTPPVRVQPNVDRLCDGLIATATRDAGSVVRRQRLTIRGVPIYKINFRLGSHVGYFCAYGAERAIYAPGYPASLKRILMAPFTGLARVFSSKRAGE